MTLVKCEGPGFSHSVENRRFWISRFFSGIILDFLVIVAFPWLQRVLGEIVLNCSLGFLSAFISLSLVYLSLQVVLD